MRKYSVDEDKIVKAIQNSDFTFEEWWNLRTKGYNETTLLQSIAGIVSKVLAKKALENGEVRKAFDTFCANMRNQERELILSKIKNADISFEDLLGQRSEEAKFCRLIGLAGMNKSGPYIDDQRNWAADWLRDEQVKNTYTEKLYLQEKKKIVAALNNLSEEKAGEIDRKFRTAEGRFCAAVGWERGSAGYSLHHKNMARKWLQDAEVQESFCKIFGEKGGDIDGKSLAWWLGTDKKVDLALNVLKGSQNNFDEWFKWRSSGYTDVFILREICKDSFKCTMETAKDLLSYDIVDEAFCAYKAHMFVKEKEKVIFLIENSQVTREDVKLLRSEASKFCRIVGVEKTLDANVIKGQLRWANELLQDKDIKAAFDACKDKLYIQEKNMLIKNMKNSELVAEDIDGRKDEVVFCLLTRGGKSKDYNDSDCDWAAEWMQDAEMKAAYDSKIAEIRRAEILLNKDLILEKLENANPEDEELQNRMKHLMHKGTFDYTKLLLILDVPRCEKHPYYNRYQIRKAKELVKDNDVKAALDDCMRRISEYCEKICVKKITSMYELQCLSGAGARVLVKLQGEEREKALKIIIANKKKIIEAINAYSGDIFLKDGKCAAENLFIKMMRGERKGVEYTPEQRANARLALSSDPDIKASFYEKVRKLPKFTFVDIRGINTGRSDM